MLIGRKPRRVLCAMLMVSLLLAVPSAMGFGFEQRAYTVLHRSGDIEYRQYEPYLVSEVVVETDGDYLAAGEHGVDRLLEYIGGRNTSEHRHADSRSKKISLTLPVQQWISPEGWRVSMMLPSQYTFATAPLPTDPGINLREVPGRLMAVRRFSGRWKQEKFAARMAELQAAIDTDNVTRLGVMQIALYNPKFTPPFMRRNEVMVEVTNLPDAAPGRSAERQAAVH